MKKLSYYIFCLGIAVLVLAIVSYLVSPFIGGNLFVSQMIAINAFLFAFVSSLFGFFSLDDEVDIFDMFAEDTLF